MVNKLNHHIYIYITKIENYFIIFWYINDILLARNSLKIIKKTKSLLCFQFKIKNMEEVYYILHIKIIRNKQSKMLHLSQEQYLNYFFKRFKMDNCKPLSTPIKKDFKMRKENYPIER